MSIETSSIDEFTSSLFSPKMTSRTSMPLTALLNSSRAGLPVRVVWVGAVPEVGGLRLLRYHDARSAFGLTGDDLDREASFAVASGSTYLASTLHLTDERPKLAERGVGPDPVACMGCLSKPLAGRRSRRQPCLCLRFVHI